MRLTTRHVILAVIALLVIASIVYSFSKGGVDTSEAESHLTNVAPQSNIELIGGAALVNDVANRDIQLIEPTGESDGFAAENHNLEEVVDGGMNGHDDVFMVYK